MSRNTAAPALPTPRRVQGTYYTLMLGNTLAASFIWGVNTLFLLDAGLSNLEAFAANAFFSAGMLIFEIPTGVVADTLGRRASYLLGTVTLAEPGSPYAETAGPGEIEVRMLAVAPDARRRGIAAALMDAAHAQARERGMRWVVLCSEASFRHVHRFYERLGYERQPERDWSPGGVPLLSFGRPVDVA